MNIRDLMARIDTLQEYDEPMVEEYTPMKTVNPLLAAMLELREEGVVDSVDAHTIYSDVQSGHREPDDFIDGDIGDRIYWFDDYKLSSLPIANINLDEYEVDEDLVDDYIEHIKYSPKTMPPIVYDPIAKSIIDGIHRANAYDKLGYESIPAYVGLTKSSSYGERESEIEEGPDGDHQTGGALGLPFPGTYEQEYDNFKQHGQRRMGTLTTEALDSSYPYEGDSVSGKYNFKTEDGIQYKVYFTDPDFTEVSFSAILPGEEENFRPDKTTLTGTGNSRKVFGTVVKIVQEYVDAHKPKALYFTASSSEPSRVRLYNTMLSQVDKALPDYTSSGNVDLGSGVAYMLKRKTDKVNEALDSSYPYEYKNNSYYFTTDAGNDYKVMFNGTKKVEVSFVSRNKAGQVKDTATGSGDSRKVFGTVINIVKDYVSNVKPNILVFSAVNNEPSRVRLYKMLANQAASALPDYNFAKALNNGLLTSFYLTKSGIKVPALDKVKAAGFKALDKIVSEDAAETVTLFNLYDGAWPDDDEMIWNYVTDSDFDTPFEVNAMRPFILDQILCDQYGVDDVEDLFHKMQPDQEAIIKDYQDDPNLPQQVIVMHGNQILDGNHRALAAVLSNRPIKYIDIGEEEDAEV